MINTFERDPSTTVARATQRAVAAARWSRSLRYYGLALLLVAAGAILRLALTHFAGSGLPAYITLYPAVMLAALIGGWRPGLLATLATAVVVNYWLLAPQGSLLIESWVDVVGVLFFSAMGLFMSVVAELYRRTRGHLEELVVVRTTALRQANGQLQREIGERQQAEETLQKANEQLQQQTEELQSQAEELQMQAEELTTANEELRVSEQALRESEERFRAAYEQAAIGIEMLDLQGGFLRGNGWLSQMLGYRENELQQRTFAQITEPDDLLEELPLLERLRAGAAPSGSWSRTARPWRAKARRP